MKGAHTGTLISSLNTFIFFCVFLGTEYQKRKLGKHTEFWVCFLAVYKKLYNAWSHAQSDADG